VTNFQVPSRQCGGEGVAVPIHLISARRTLAHDQDQTEFVGPPFPLGGDQLGYQAGLPVEHGQHLLKIVHLGLDLDDQQRSPLGLPTQNIDGADLAKVAERVLHGRSPAQSCKDTNDGIDQFRVPAIQKSREFATPPSRCERKPDFERGTNASNGVEPQAPEIAALHVRHCPLTDAGLASDVDLAQPSSMTDSTDHISNA
jgi:hypothetical protein